MARNFSGNDQHLVLSAATTAYNCQASFTIALWARADGANDGGMASKTNAAQWAWDFYQDSGEVKFFSQNSDVVVSGFTPTAGEWVHLAVTRDGTDYRFYGDGLLKATVTADAPTLGNNTVVEIGRDGDFGATADFEGDLADVAVWGEVQLNINEIAALARGRRPDEIRRADLQMYVPLDGLESPEPELILHDTFIVTGATLTTGPPIRMSFVAPVLVGEAPEAGDVAAAILTGVGTIDASGFDIGVLAGRATLIGAGLISATPFVSVFAAATLSGAGEIVATGNSADSADATITGTGAIVATGKALELASSTFSGAGFISATPGGIRAADASLTGVGGLSGTGFFFDFPGGEAILNGSGFLLAKGRDLNPAAVETGGRIIRRQLEGDSE